MRRLPPLPFVLVALTLLVTAASPVPPVGRSRSHSRPLSALNPMPPIERGLAQLDWSHNGDRALLAVTQFYAWSMNACGGDYVHCTPMNRNWDMAAQTFCPPVELLGNEPTNPEPAGHPITATLAASVTVSIEQACPGIKLVASNIHLNNGGTEALDWLTDYLAAYKSLTGHDFTHFLGVHCYAQWAADCAARIKDLAALPYTGKFWLTEFGIYGDAPYTTGTELAKFLKALPLLLPGRIERAYIWTNRGNWPFDLVSANGTLTDMGQAWAGWQPPGVWQAHLPMAGQWAAYP